MFPLDERCAYIASTLGSIIDMVASVLYIVSIFRGHTHPSRISWLIW